MHTGGGRRQHSFCMLRFNRNEACRRRWRPARRLLTDTRAFPFWGVSYRRAACRYQWDLLMVVDPRMVRRGAGWRHCTGIWSATGGVEEWRSGWVLREEHGHEQLSFVTWRSRSASRQGTVAECRGAATRRAGSPAKVSKYLQYIRCELRTFCEACSPPPG